MRELTVLSPCAGQAGVQGGGAEEEVRGGDGLPGGGASQAGGGGASGPDGLERPGEPAAAPTAVGRNQSGVRQEAGRSYTPWGGGRAQARSSQHNLHQRNSNQKSVFKSQKLQSKIPRLKENFSCST